MTLEEKKAALVEEITLIPDAYERLGYIVDRGKKAPGLTEDLRKRLRPQASINGASRDAYVKRVY